MYLTVVHSCPAMDFRGAFAVLVSVTLRSLLDALVLGCPPDIVGQGECCIASRTSQLCVSSKSSMVIGLVDVRYSSLHL